MQSSLSFPLGVPNSKSMTKQKCVNLTESGQATRRLNGHSHRFLVPSFLTETGRDKKMIETTNKQTTTLSCQNKRHQSYAIAASQTNHQISKSLVTKGRSHQLVVELVLATQLPQLSQSLGPCSNFESHANYG